MQTTVRIQTCRNCGETGHVHRHCSQPVTSFGIIAYQRSRTDGRLRVLLVQRRDSLAFSELVRGRYSVTDVTYVCQLLEQMTIGEREMLLTHSFSELWSHFWHAPFTGTTRYAHEYEDARGKFETLRRGVRLCTPIGDAQVSLRSLLAASKSEHVETEWGFPKGRRRIREADTDAAMREFAEETGLSRADMTQEAGPFVETFVGTNRVPYRHVYYLCRLRDDATPPAVDENNLNQVREIKAVALFEPVEVLARIRPHNIERRELFLRVLDLLRPPEPCSKPSDSEPSSN